MSNHITITVDGDTIMDTTPSAGQFLNTTPDMEALTLKGGAATNPELWFLAILPDVAQAIQRARYPKLYPPPPDSTRTCQVTVTLTDGNLNIEANTTLDTEQG